MPDAIVVLVGALESFIIFFGGERDGPTEREE
jgi:hypothetical protein